MRAKSALPLLLLLHLPPIPPTFPARAPSHISCLVSEPVETNVFTMRSSTVAGGKKEEENQTRFYWLSILTAESGKKNDALKKVSVCCALYSPPPKRIIAIKSMTRHALHGVSDEVLLHIDLLFSSMRMFCNYLGTCLSARFQQHAFLECILHDR